MSYATGKILVHTLQTRDRMLHTGEIINDLASRQLLTASFKTLTAVLQEPGDVPEGEAATQLAQLLLGECTSRATDTHGWVNIFI